MGYRLRMPWKETCAMNEWIRMIREYCRGGYSISALARRYDVSRKSVYKWIERYERQKWEGLSDMSRAPLHHPNALSASMEENILGLRKQWPLWGAPKIHVKLQEQPQCPSESTVSNVLERHGLTRKARPRRSATPSQQPLSHCQQVNQVWCTDFKGWFRTGDGSRCDPLTITDAHSRYLLRCQAMGGSTGTQMVVPLFTATFREYGLREAMRSDNGSPFATTGLAGLSTLSVWWIRLGIRLERITPGHPGQNGCHSRRFTVRLPWRSPSSRK